MMRTPIVACIVPVWILLGAFFTVGFSFSFYQHEFHKYHVETVTHLSNDETHDELTQLLFYLTGHSSSLSPRFSEKEQRHLYDVKQLIQRALVLFITLTLVLVGFLTYARKHSVSLLRVASLVSCIFFVVLLVLGKVLFGILFLQFHLVAFSNTDWMLDPQIDLLIQLFPQEIFADVFIRILLTGLVASGVLFVITSFVYWKAKALNKPI